MATLKFLYEDQTKGALKRAQKGHGCTIPGRCVGRSCPKTPPLPHAHKQLDFRKTDTEGIAYLLPGYIFPRILSFI